MDENFTTKLNTDDVTQHLAYLR